MPRFYISFRNGSTITKDDTGIELPGVEEARAIAVGSARELIGHAIAFDGKTIVDAVIVADENGNELLNLPGKDVLPESLK